VRGRRRLCGDRGGRGGALARTRRALPLTGARAGRAGSWDVAAYGLPYGLAIGPYGALLALTWQRNMGGDTYLIQLDRQRPGARRAAPRPRHAC